MGSKKPDAKAIVSFSSDSDEEDSSSSSSRLSSSASSGEDSEVETFSVAFPAPGKPAAQGVAVGRGGGGEASAKVESKTRPETKKTEPVKAISPEPRKSPVADVKDKSSLKNTNVSEEAAAKKDPITTKDKLTASDSIKEVRKSPGKQEDTSGTLDVTKKGGSSVPSERAKSPKITINDVDEEDTAKQTKKSPGNDVTVTSSKLTSKTRATSPKKTSNDDVEAELPSLSLKSRKDVARAVSPKKEDTAEDVSEVTKTPKRSPKLTAEREKSPKDTEEEPVSVSEVKSVDRAKSPKKAAVDKDVERAKSPKKTLDVQDSERAKSLKETDAERAKSPKKTAEDGGEAKKKSSKDSSKTPYELLRSVESPEKSPTRSTKPKKSLTTTEDDSTTTPKRKSPLKDLEGKEQEDVVETAKPKKSSKKTAKTILNDENEINDNVAISRKDDEAARSEKVKDGDQSQKIGVSETKVKDQSDTASEVEQLLKEIRQKRINNQLESETPEVDGGGVDKLIRVTVDDATGKTDDSSKSPREAEVKDKDYMKVTGTSRKSPADETSGTKPELENEESEFTYRRKSMDDFIKRILAEAKEERLKQKHGGAASNETSTTTEGDERKVGVDRYAERNGGITENGLDGGTKWNGGGGGSGISAEDKEGSKMLDRRLAKIEKRRFGDSASDAGKGEGGGGGAIEGGRSKIVGKETEEKSGKDKADYDVNLDEDLEEINRFLQSRKTAAASRFNFDEQQLNDDDDHATTTPTTATPTKRRWATNKDPQQLPGEEDDLQPRSQIKKKYSSNVDVDLDDDDERFLGRFKRDSVAVPEESFSPRRRDETDEIIRERTRNVRVLVDQQVEIVQAMRTTSKSLDDLEKEIREVRQVCMNRQARIEALEGELGAEYRAFENDQVAATDRQKDGSLMGSREDFGGLAGMGRLRRQDKFKSESLDEENFPFRRRSGSVASTTSYTSGFESSRGRPGEDGGLDSRPPSGLKQSRRTSEGESDLSSGLDRRRGGSAARDRISDVTPFGPDDLSNSFLSQRSARSRASIATSTPAVDYAGTISGDSFLAKIRAKYSFLNPALDSQSYSSPSSIRGSSGISSSSYTTPSSLTYGKRLGSRDILSSPSAYSSYSTGGYGVSPSFTTTGGISGGRYSSIRDSRSPSYGSGGFIGSSSITGGISSSYGDSGGRMRRAQSVSEMSFDRPSASSPTNLGSSSGGEFHSRFLDKVRGKKAMGDDFGTSSVPSASSVSSSSSQSKGGEKPFKSRFLKTTSSFDAGSSRSDRLTNGFEDGNDAGGYGRGGTSEINGDA